MRAWPITNTGWTVGSSGDRCTATSFELVYCVGQPGVVEQAAGASVHSYDGFIAGAALRPGLDHDLDGLCDECDADNDNDGLDDEVEITGTAFSPLSTTDVNAEDTDGDGMADGAEAVAGTDPRNASASLHIIHVVPLNAGDMEISWPTRAGKSYRVLCADTPEAARITNVLHTATATSGSGPWLVGTNRFIDATQAGTTQRYYRIKVTP